MRTSFVRLISRLLVVCLTGLPFQANAGLIGTDQVVTAAQAQAARATVLSQISRAEVAARLQSLGLTAQSARDRVAALTDAEVTRLAGQIDSLPAGAGSEALLVIVILGLLLWWIIKN
jgi:hypothetical protein